MTALLLLPTPARAHGDPVSEVLLEQDLFLPLHMKRDSHAAQQLGTVVREANEAGFHVKVAVVADPTDLGPRSDFYDRPRPFAQFLAADVSARDGVLVVMPSGLAYATTIGTPAARSRRALVGLRAPGRDARNEARSAALAVHRLAAASGYTIALTGSGSASETRDRIVIAAAAAVAAALLAGGMLYRRRRRTH